MIKFRFNIFLFLISNVFIPRVLSQAYFEAPDTICIDDTLQINNLSRDANTYYWSFCSGNLHYEPQGVNIPNPGTLNGPAFIDFAEDNDNYYAFITNHTDATITRNFYGEDFLNTPTSVNLGNFGSIIPPHVQGIEVVNDNGNWYAFIVGGQREESRLVRLDFGNSLSNNPTATNLGNIGDMDYPGDLYIVNDNGNWYGFTVNYNNSSITRFDFGNSLSSPPTAINLGSGLGLNQPCGIYPIREKGYWYFFITNYNSHEITRLYFGDNLSNTPSAQSIGDPETLYYPFGITILQDCERYYGFVLNRFGDIVRIEFNGGIESDPEFTSLGEVGALYNPQGLSDVFRVGDTLYTFVANIDNSSITRLFFPGCDNASPPSSTDRDPPPVTYNAPGSYNIALVLDEGTINQENYCKNLVVLESPEIDLGNDTLLQPGTTIDLDAGDSIIRYEWSTGESSQVITVDEPELYSVRITNQYGCTNTDEILIEMDYGVPNFFTPNNDGYNDTWEIPILRDVTDARIQVFDRFGNLVVSYLSGDRQWDGTRNGNPLPEDTYWYVILLEGESKPHKGQVTIKR